MLLLGPVLKDSRVSVTTVVVYLSIFLLLFFILNEKNKSVLMGKDPAANYVDRNSFSRFVSELLLWSSSVA